MNGVDDVILIDKPAGMTSFGVVARVRRVLREQAGTKVKVGHTGTLDPFATGLLILVTGKKCREAMQYTKLDKWYETDIVLGVRSSTGDPEGELTTVSDTQPTERQVVDALRRHTGVLSQRPPQFSAIKINGQRAYHLARQGHDVVMPERQVTIYELQLLSYDYPVLRCRAHVSSGTYIRSLAADIGEALGTGAYCRSLRRTRIADYDVSQAQTLGDFGVTS